MIRCACGKGPVEVSGGCRACYQRKWRAKNLEYSRERQRNYLRAKRERERLERPAVLRAGRVDNDGYRDWKWPRELVRVPIKGWGCL